MCSSDLGCRWVVDAEAADMLWRVALFEVDKCSVKYSQLFHMFLALACGDIPVTGRPARTLALMSCLNGPRLQ